jgi:hypothetical protein
MEKRICHWPYRGRIFFTGLPGPLVKIQHSRIPAHPSSALLRPPNVSSHPAIPLFVVLTVMCLIDLLFIVLSLRLQTVCTMPWECMSELFKTNSELIMLTKGCVVYGLDSQLYFTCHQTTS